MKTLNGVVNKYKTNKNIIDYKYDIVVVGGGPAGVAAAYTAASKGNTVILIESQGFLGGQAVGGLSATICGLYSTNEQWTSENGPEQIVFGFAEKIRSNLKKSGGLTEPQLYGNTYLDVHQPFVWKTVAEKMLQDVGVKILYHTTVVEAIKDDSGEIKSVLALGMSEYFQISGRNFIDTSGDAVLVAITGGEYRFGNNGIVQNPSLIYKLNNINDEVFWKYYGENTICHEDFSSKIREAEKLYNEEMPRKKIWVFKSNNNEIYVNATSISADDGSSLNCIKTEDITKAEIKGRKQAQTYAKFFKDFIPGCENCTIGEHSSQIGVRQTRSIIGIDSLKNTDVENCVKRVDGIAKSSWPIELHKGEAPKLVWLTNDYYEIPYGAMVPQGYSNLIVAGRCIDAEHEALASCRVTAQCFSMGQAAGVASDLSIKGNIPFPQIDGKLIRMLLNKDGAELD